MGLFDSEAVAPNTLDNLNVTTNVITSRLCHLDIEALPDSMVESVQKLSKAHE
jgi:hypothetical protein